MRKFLFIFSSIILFSVSQNGWALIDPWSLPNYLQDLSTAINSATQVRQQLLSLKNEAKNLGTVSDYRWQNVTQLLRQMDQASHQGKAISYQMSDVDTQFRQQYPDYTNSAYGQMNYSNAYKNWNDTTLDTLRSTLSASSVDAQNAQTEEQVLEQLKAQGRSATGRMQVLQVSTELAGENVDQLMQLKRLMMAQMNAQNAYMAYQVSKDSYNEQALKALVSHVDTQFPRYQENTHFGTLPSIP